MSKDKEPTAETTVNFNTDQLIGDYIRKHVTLAIGSVRHNNYDSKYDVTIRLLVDSSPISQVQFTV